MPGPKPSIRGPGGSNEYRNKETQGGKEPLTPDRAYEPTGSFPEQPEWGGRARFTRSIKGPSMKDADEGPAEPAYEPGPSRRHKRES